jgi:carboxypeptidase C (cathepsin A)
MIRRSLVLALTTTLIACAVAALPLLAAEVDKGKAGEKAKEKPEEKEKEKEAEKETKSVTENEVTVAGQKISYTATAGTLPLMKVDGEKRASVFYIAYERKGTTDTARRPLVFCFNGGPGSSSVWLHLGAFGPRRVVLPTGGIETPKPPYELAGNEHSLLDVADLVFIDPVSTGFSRAQKPDEAKQFHGYTEDINSVGEFIHRWVSKNNRWVSPKFLAGESYGGLRAAGLAGHLQGRYGMYLSGLVIVSGVVDFKTLSADEGNDVPYLTYLPTMTSIAHFHKKLPPDLQQGGVAAAATAAEAYALGEYSAALLRGNTLSAEETQKVAAQLARFSGLPADLWVRERLRVGPGLFRRKLLEAENKLIGRYDARVTVDASSDEDPSYANILGAYATLLNAYVRGDLKYESELAYEVLTRDVQPWSYASFTGRYVTSASALGDAMSNNPSLRVFIACGNHDLATPGGGIRYTMNHLTVDPARIPNITVRDYDGGHMMYTNADSLGRLNADVRAFIVK